ncbi:MAG: hypothetical protein V1777_02310 [Candidatus Micrarchaeota archaeon]
MKKIPRYPTFARDFAAAKAAKSGKKKRPPLWELLAKIRTAEQMKKRALELQKAQKQPQKK